MPRFEISTHEVPMKREEVLKRAMMTFLNKSETTVGIKRCHIITGLSQDFSVEEIDSAIENLNRNGEIYPNGSDIWCSNS
jgi:hypothetical protein